MQKADIAAVTALPFHTMLLVPSSYRVNKLVTLNSYTYIILYSCLAVVKH